MVPKQQCQQHAWQSNMKIIVNVKKNEQDFKNKETKQEVKKLNVTNKEENKCKDFKKKMIKNKKCNHIKTM